MVDEKFVLRDEPIRRRGSAGKAHLAEFCYRTGGEAVHACRRHANGATSAQFQQIVRGDLAAKRWGWRAMRRNPIVLVRGSIRHPDHSTIVLSDWHQVLPNTENLAAAMRNLAFLD
ncbi:MAG TPA: hypothetical protein VND64_02485 [Pirellulales bacterium]|nr:hypothetical protein [Pirellulales bacterium]